MAATQKLKVNTKKHKVTDKSRQSKVGKKLKKVLSLPRGFLLSGVKANIKYKNRFDLALIYSHTPCVAAGVWTKNSIQAACITYNKSHIKNKIQAIMINSGYANACTSIQGDKNCLISAKALASNLKIDSDAILLASTGVIGQQLPIDKIIKNIPKLVQTKNNTQDSIKCASKAIMTTDTYPKIYGVKMLLQESDSVESPDSKTVEQGNEEIDTQEKSACNELQVSDKEDSKYTSAITDNTIIKKPKKIKAKVWGMAKGSGMIHPNMATMLGFVMTDVAIKQDLLQEALSEVVQQSFNQISVDGDTSTNDMVVVLANGKAGNREIQEKNADYEVFKLALQQVCIKLAKKIARDGEGATHLLEVVIKEAKTLEQAQKLSKAIIGSNLVKTAIFGKDANWGRIICAMGYSEMVFDSTKLDLFFESKKGKIVIAKDGVGVQFNENKARKILSADTVRIVVNLKDGDYSAKAWGCDLSYDYIRINADYRS